jgi:hypothetical protein
MSPCVGLRLARLRLTLGSVRVSDDVGQRERGGKFEGAMTELRLQD